MSSTCQLIEELSIVCQLPVRWSLHRATQSALLRLLSVLLVAGDDVDTVLGTSSGADAGVAAGAGPVGIEPC